MTHSIGLHVIFGALLAGVVVPREDDGTLDPDLVRPLNDVSSLLSPFFFVVSGRLVALESMGPPVGSPCWWRRSRSPRRSAAVRRRPPSPASTFRRSDRGHPDARLRSDRADRPQRGFPGGPVEQAAVHGPGLHAARYPDEPG
ncbi:cation:proton antiporter [Streptomyces canus]|uniref:cation:proton antiporter domain-containing protein n=1 Tax=Streptomyces canus TaxID=58343 RepID=UPI0030DE2798